MLLFAEARSVEWLFAARILQGVATGIAMGAISAALLDLHPTDNPRLGALVGVAAPLTGMAVGALVSGFLVQYGPEPMRLVFWLLLGGFALAIAAVAGDPGDGRGDAAWPMSLRPRSRCPPRSARRSSRRSRAWSRPGRSAASCCRSGRR